MVTQVTTEALRARLRAGLATLDDGALPYSERDVSALLLRALMQGRYEGMAGAHVALTTLCGALCDDAAIRHTAALLDRGADLIGEQPHLVLYGPSMAEQQTHVRVSPYVPGVGGVAVALWLPERIYRDGDAEEAR